MTLYLTCLFLLALSIIIILLFGRKIISISRKFGLVHIPLKNSHNVNPTKTPLAGGLVLLAGFIPSGFLGYYLVRDHQTTHAAISLLIPLLIIFMFGIWDDFKNLNPYMKLFGQFLAITVFLLFGKSVSIFDLHWLNILLTYFWLMGIINAFNLIDSREGICVGISINTSVILLLGSVLSGQAFLVVVSVSLLGSCIGLKYFNMNPGKTFLGDSGAQSLGFLLGSLSLLYDPRGYQQAASWFLPILFFYIPLYDTAFVMVNRIIQHRPLFKGDTFHTYHRLSRILKNDNDAIHLMVIFSLLIDIIALMLLEVNNTSSNIYLAILIILSIVGGIILRQLDPQTYQNDGNNSL